MFKKMKKQSEEKNRKSGIDIVGNVPWGAHFCQFYRTKKDLIDILVPYFKAGLENNEFCMWVTSEPLMTEEAKAALKKVVKNLDDYIKNGQIEILDYTQWYTKSGKFEADKVLQGWVKKEEQAIKKGFDGLRLTGNTFWLEKKDWKKFADYEVAISNTIDKHRIIAICSYSLDKCGTSEVIDVVSTHQLSLIKRNNRWISVESAEKKKAEERYNIFFNNVSDAITIVNPKTRKFVDFNNAAEKLTEYSRKELSSMTFDLIHPKEKIREIAASMKKSAETQTIAIMETEILTKDKKRVSVILSGGPIKIGDKMYMQAIFKDITEIKKAQEKLEASETRYRSYIEVTKQLGWTTNAKGMVTEDIPTWRAYTGQSFEQIKNWGWVKAIHPDDAKRTAEVWKKAVKTKSTYETEYRVCGKDGKYRWFLARGVPLLKEDGSIHEWVGTCIDITELKKAQEEIKESEAKYKTILESGNDGVLAVDAQTKKFIFLNKQMETITGYNRKELFKITTDKIHPEKDRKWIMQEFQKIATGKSELAVGIPVERKNKEIIICDIRAIVTQMEGRPVVIAFFRDVTEMKKAQEELKESEEKYKILFVSSADAIMTLEPPSWRFTSGNPATVKMFNTKDEKEFTYLGPWQLSPEKQLDGQLSSEKAKAMIMKAMKEGSNFFEWTHKRYKGGDFPATVLLTRIEKSGKKFLQATVRDITEQKKSEEKIKKARNELADKVTELEKFNKIAIGRELKMVELKKRIGELERQLDKG
jgi:PAS domain S-box-containing protein